MPVEVRQVRDQDLRELNRIFSEAFTAVYRRAGMTRAQVPLLTEEFLRLEWEVSGKGALLLHDSRRVVGFVFARVHGSEGWFGPLAVHPDSQGKGYGKKIVVCCVEYLKGQGCTTIGLETMPRTFANLGLYTKLGFRPEQLVFTVNITIPRDVETTRNSDLECILLGNRNGADRRRWLKGIARFCDRIYPGLDYSDEIRRTLELGFGDVLLFARDGEAVAFVLFHDQPYFVSDGFGAIRVARLGVPRDLEGNGLLFLLDALLVHGRGRKATELHVRCQTSDWEATKHLLGAGYRVVYSDLRMTLEGYPQGASPEYVHFSRWG